MRIEPYGRFWAVYMPSGELLCVTVYKKGARAVVDAMGPARCVAEIAELERECAEQRAIIRAFKQGSITASI